MLKSIKNIKLFSVLNLLTCLEQIGETLNKLYRLFSKGTSSKFLEILLVQDIKNCKNIQFEGTIFIY